MNLNFKLPVLELLNFGRMLPELPQESEWYYYLLIFIIWLKKVGYRIIIAYLPYVLNGLADTFKVSITYYLFAGDPQICSLALSSKYETQIFNSPLNKSPSISHRILKLNSDV